MHTESHTYVRFIDNPEDFDNEVRTAVGFDEPFVDMTTAEILAELKDVAGYPVVYYWERDGELLVYQPDPDQLEQREIEEREELEQARREAEAWERTRNGQST